MAYLSKHARLYYSLVIRRKLKNFNQVVEFFDVVRISTEMVVIW